MADQFPQMIDPHIDEMHRSRLIANGKDLSMIRVRAGPPLEYKEAYGPLLRQTGLMGLAIIMHDHPPTIDQALITALIDRWRPETHTFHLPCGEMTVTLQDVAMLLGLPIDGQPVTFGRPAANWRQLLVHELGKAPDEVAPGKRDRRTAGLSRMWLRTNFHGRLFEEMDDPDDWSLGVFVKAYILSLLGNVMFPDAAGDTISTALIPLIHDFEVAGQYSWGSGVLAYLYRQLCEACTRSCISPSIGGCAILLQLWVWERFSMGRPNMVAWSPPPPRDHPHDYPTVAAMYRWSRMDHQAPVNCYTAYMNEFDMLTASDVYWEPYEREELVSLGPLNPLCKRDERLWRTRAPLIFFYAVEMHFPNRVRRQFGKLQEYPPSRVSTSRELHKISRQKKPGVKDWENEHRAYIEQWENREGNVDDETSICEERTYRRYLRFLHENSRLRLRLPWNISDVEEEIPSGDDSDEIEGNQLGDRSCFVERAPRTHYVSDELLRIVNQTEKAMNTQDTESIRPFLGRLRKRLRRIIAYIGSEGVDVQLPSQAQLSWARSSRIDPSRASSTAADPARASCSHLHPRASSSCLDIGASSSLPSRGFDDDQEQGTERE